MTTATTIETTIETMQDGYSTIPVPDGVSCENMTYTAIYRDPATGKYWKGTNWLSSHSIRPGERIRETLRKLGIPFTREPFADQRVFEAGDPCEYQSLAASTDDPRLIMCYPSCLPPGLSFARFRQEWTSRYLPAAGEVERQIHWERDVFAARRSYLLCHDPAVAAEMTYHGANRYSLVIRDPETRVVLRIEE